MKKSVVVVEDDGGLREQLVSVLKSSPDIDCLYAVSTGEEAIRKIPARPPDVVLMDIKLPGISGIDCIIPLKRACPTTEIVMLTIYENTESIFRALKAGASGYLIKSSNPEILFGAIRDVYTGGAPFSSHIARKVVQYFQEEGKSARENEKLSAREREVLDLLAQGYMYLEVGKKLFISDETVRSHVKNICRKMQVRNRVEAVAKHRAG
jgi:DNA-binding NarL/FixJ family response regulator